MKTSTLICLVIALILTACGSGQDDPTATPEPPTGGPDPMAVAGLIGHTRLGDDVRVVGYVVIDTTGSHLCSVLLESFPPQCGGDSVDIAGIEDLGLDLEEERGVRWSNTQIVFSGRWADGLYTALAVP